MLDYKNALEIRHDDAGSFKDYKNEAMDFARDTFTLSLDKDADYLYVGFYKPINTIYVAAVTPNTASGSLGGEFYNGTSFVAMTELSDETKNLSRDGFISWEKNQTDEVITTVNGTEAFWYRFRPTVTTSAIVFQAINILFSDDQALVRKFSKILSTEFLDGELNYNKVHEACRDEIVGQLQRQGYVSNGPTDIRNNSSLKLLSPWSIHDVFEIKEAAGYLALHKIFFSFSDKSEDIWMVKSKEYKKIYEDCILIARISIDNNDDGVQTSDEVLEGSKTRYWVR